MYHEHLLCPEEERYVRSVTTHKIEGNKTFHLVVCMLPAMSSLLLETKRISIDNSFERLHKWQEFEIEAWLSKFNCCKCHFILLEMI